MLTQKTWMTKDARGCEFQVTGCLVTEKKFIGGKIVRVVVESSYSGLGLKFANLKDLKKAVANIQG